MRKRLAILLGLVVLILGAAYLTLWLTTPRPMFTRADFEKIQDGMTEAQVVAVLGMSAGNHSTGDLLAVTDPHDAHENVLAEFTVAFFQLQAKDSSMRERGRRLWIGNQGIIAVDFSPSGRITYKEYVAAYRKCDDPLTQLRRLLGL